MAKAKTIENHPLSEQKAPKFKNLDQASAVRTLKDFAGKWLVLYFYPRDLTPGCTVEAKEFADLAPSFAEQKCEIVGVSPDTPETHIKFCVKHGLPFTLLADPNHELAEAYCVWTKKSMYGKNFMGIQRSTFLIDDQGIIRHVWSKVSPKGHAMEVLKTLEGFR